ncbi:MAG: hypothetical protein FJ143_17055 [Deltaproteobacteria bacterium]|nr:hypothetical protein [Deltaproteobacteria bacterium]
MSWDDLVASASDACDEAFAEAFEFRPMRQLTVNDPVSPDPGRAVREVLAIYGAPASDIDLGQLRPQVSRTLGGDATGRVSIGTPRIGVDLRQFAPGEPPRKGDKFMRKKTGDVFSAKDYQPDGQGRAVLSLAHLNRESI